jgi:nitroreductase
MASSASGVPLNPAALLDALHWRYATKRFDPTRRIPGEVWQILEQSLVLTPSSFGLQPWKFLIIEDPDVRTRLRAASWGQPQVTDASHYLVLTARTAITPADIDDWTSRLSEVQGTPSEALAPLRKVITGFTAAMTPDALLAWNIRQVYIALGQLMTAAALLGIDACPMEGIDPAAYDAVLGLSGGEHTTAVGCALGYRAADDRHAGLPKARFPAARVIRRI